ncbi:MAG: HU family DNA-binding protein [Bacteroidaceae bacterium]|nr:HU family DNA-binding protein [Bacteroidaceae bacterium]
MSEKLNHSDISALLAKETGISVAKSEAFTKNLFDLIIEGLEQDGIVKINGIGTFKITDVANRSSVNVNTGEKFEIKGHKKLSFVPAEVLKDAVNQPFAMFEPVEVDDSYTDDDDVAGEADENTEVIAEEQPAVTGEPFADECENDVTEEAETVASKNGGSENEDEGTEEAHAAVSAAVTAEETSDETVNDASEAAQEQEYQPETVAEEPIIEEPESKEPEKIEPEKNETAGKKDTAAVTPRRERSGKKALLTIIIMLALGAGYYWFINKENENEATQRQKQTLLAVAGENGIDAKSAKVEAKPIEEKPTEQPVVKDTVADSNIQAIASQPQHETVEEKQAGTVVMNKEYKFVMATELSVRKDRDIAPSDTTLYAIKGEVAVHEVAADENLAKISLKYYGSRKLWPYIAKYNNLSDPGGISAGMRLTIPELRAK